MMVHADFNNRFNVYLMITELHAKIWFQVGITHKMD